MKGLFGFRNMLLAFAALGMAQFACNFSAQAPTAPPPPAPAPSATVGMLPTPPASPVSSQFGTPEQAITMLKEAVQHYQTVGREKALADFTNRVPPFFFRDLYVACIDSNLIQSANGGYPNLVGSGLEPLSRANWDAASQGQISSINYDWLDPNSGNMLPKTFYYEKVGSDVCGVGAYHP